MLIACIQWLHVDIPAVCVAEDVPENHVVSEDVGMLTGVTECHRDSPLDRFGRMV